VTAQLHTGDLHTGWLGVCRYDDLIPERGVAALVDGAPVAIFRTHDGALYALSNLDPFSGASVLSRGIVGDRGGQPTVASPIYKQVFQLATGVCLDDPEVSVRAYPVRVVDGVVEVGSR
jgi:nitrite reductase (NADH) small subunit